MNRNLLIVCLLTCSMARGQAFFAASPTELPADLPNRAHATLTAATIRQFSGASIKLPPVRTPQTNALSVYPDGRIRCTHCTLQFLATLAFDLPDWQVAGSSEWMGDAQFNLEATTPERSQPVPWNAKKPLTIPQRQMLQALLTDRFRLEGHRETRTHTVYILQRSNQPLKLATATGGAADTASVTSSAGIAAKNISMPELASRIGRVLKHPVVDQTGLSGTFDFDCSAGDMAGDEVADAVFDSIGASGLKLTPTTVSVETLVIDHAEPPTED